MQRKSCGELSELLRVAASSNYSIKGNRSRSDLSPLVSGVGRHEFGQTSGDKLVGRRALV